VTGQQHGRGLGRLALAPDEPDQVPRLIAFRQANPGVIIGDGGFGTMQARIPEENGETVVTRYSLRELLDKLESIMSSPPGAGGGIPRREPPGGG
jgi:hypothetical protein